MRPSRRAHEAGVNLVRAEDQLRLMQRQNNDLMMRRTDSERMLSEIKAVNVFVFLLIG